MFFSFQIYSKILLSTIQPVASRIVCLYHFSSFIKTNFPRSRYREKYFHSRLFIHYVTAESSFHSPIWREIKHKPDVSSFVFKVLKELRQMIKILTNIPLIFSSLFLKVKLPFVSWFSQICASHILQNSSSFIHVKLYATEYDNSVTILSLKSLNVS